MLEPVLGQLGLDDAQVKAYLLLFDHGPLTASAFARELHIPRSSVYGLIKELQTLGVVTESASNGVKQFATVSLEALNELFQEKIDQLANAQREFSTVASALRERQSSKLVTPTFQLFRGEEELRHALKDMLLYYNLDTFAFWPIKEMLAVLSPDFFRYLNKVRIRNNLYTRAIWPADQVVDLDEHPYLGTGEGFEREIRIAPKEVDFSLGYWSYGTKVVFISSQKEQTGFIIESSELVATLKAQFDLIWQLSKPLESSSSAPDRFLEELNQYRS